LPKDLSASLMIAAYLAVVVLFGWFTRKRAGKSEEDYLAAGRSIGALTGGFAFASTYSSASAFMGSLGAIAILGFSFAAWVNVFVIGMMVFMAHLIAPHLRRTGLLTIPDFYSHRYGNTFRVISAAITTIIMWVYLVAQVKAMGLIVSDVLGIDYGIGIWVALAFIIYVVLGGMYATILTSALQEVMMLATAFLVAGAIFLKMGWGGSVVAASAAAPYLFSVAGKPGTVFGWSFGLIVLLGSLAMPHLTMRVYSSADEGVARRTVALGAILTAALYAVMFAVPAAVIALGIKLVDPDLALMNLAGRLLPAPLIGFVAASILAAAMSTTDAQLMTAGSAIVHDIYSKAVRRGSAIPLERAVLLNRIVMLLLGLAAILVAMNPPGLIVLIMGLAMAIAAGSLLVPLLGGIWWKRANEPGGVAAALAGLATVLALHPMVLGGALGVRLPSPHLAGLYGVAASALLYILVSLATRPPSEDEVRLFEKMHGRA
jgi:sodium/proline symporter